jgi:hypothetical protein
MSLLTMAQGAAKRLNLNSPSAIIGNTNKEIIQLLNLAQEEGIDLAQRCRWQRLVGESTFTSIASESQGAMTSLAGTDFGWIANDTIWNRTKNRKMYPVDDVQWQQMKSSGITGPVEYFRIRGNTFRVIPTMTAGDTVAFEWVSKNWRFKKYKGLDYAEDFNQYEGMVANAMARDGAKKHLTTGRPMNRRFLDRSSAAEGNWTL